MGVVLVGDGPERHDLELSAQSNAAVVVAPASVPKTAVATVLRGLRRYGRPRDSDSGVPVRDQLDKLFDYMAAAKPIAFACDSAYDPVASVGAGVTIPCQMTLSASRTHSCRPLADASPEDRARMGAAGRAYVEREHSIARLGDTLESVVLRGARG